MALKMHASLMMPAGQWLKEAVIVPEDIPLGKLADHLSISRQALSAVLSGRSALTSHLAVRIEKALGVSAETLMTMQASYELAQAREKESVFPIEAMIQKSSSHEAPSPH